MLTYKIKLLTINRRDRLKLKKNYPYRSKGTPSPRQELQRLFPVCITVLWVQDSQTDRQLLQYTADRAVIQTGKNRRNWWRGGGGGCLCFYKDISSLFETIKIRTVFLTVVLMDLAVCRTVRTVVVVVILCAGLSWWSSFTCSSASDWASSWLPYSSVAASTASTILLCSSLYSLYHSSL